MKRELWNVCTIGCKWYFWKVTQVYSLQEKMKPSVKIKSYLFLLFPYLPCQSKLCPVFRPQAHETGFSHSILNQLTDHIIEQAISSYSSPLPISPSFFPLYSIVLFPRESLRWSFTCCWEDKYFQYLRGWYCRLYHCGWYIAVSVIPSQRMLTPTLHVEVSTCSQYL